MNHKKKIGLVMEGGAMRGMFTCGVIDVLMEHGITFDGAVGVSAGAAFGCNYKSGQIGRGIRYNKRFCKDKRYASIGNLIRTGDLYEKEFCYHEVPYVLDPFDTEAFEANPMEFYVTCTDVMTGKPVYYRCKKGGPEDTKWIRASASMPLVSRVVKIGDRKLLDGGIGESIPIRFMEHKGYEKNVIILTQPLNYVKKKNQYMPALRVLLRKYPKMNRAIANRHLRYNATTAYIRTQELMGNVFVIRPPEALNIGSMERDANELERVYQIGRKEATRVLGELLEYMNK